MSLARGGCPAPFVNEALFPRSGGDVAARFCERFSPESPSCCLSCPAENWFYPDRILTLFTVSEGVAIAGLVCCAYLLLSYAVLPTQYTGRHHLSVSLVLACFIMTFALVIPLLARGPVCYDTITPHDMKSNLSCAFSGSMLIGGGFAIVMWAFLRTLNVHLQICWRFTPGKVFFYGAQLAGWGTTIVFIAVPLSVTGLAYRFGDACHLRSTNSLGSFWGPLLAVAATSIVLQFVTLIYCIKVYISSLFDDSTETHTTGASSVIPRTQASSVRTLTARQTFHRIKKVLLLQWRGIILILIVLGDVIFLATIFLGFNAITEPSPANKAKTAPWIFCMVSNGGNKEECLPLAKDIIIPETIAFAMLFLLSCNGIWALILLGRFSTITGWINLVRAKFGKTPEGDEFVSYNAALSERNPRSFEMLAANKETGGKSDLESYSTDSRSASVNGKHKNEYEDGLYGSKAYRREYPLGKQTELQSRFSTGSLHTDSAPHTPNFEALKMPPYPVGRAYGGEERTASHGRAYSGQENPAPQSRAYGGQERTVQHGRAYSNQERPAPQGRAYGGHGHSASVSQYNFDRDFNFTPPYQQPAYGIALGSPTLDNDDDQPRGGLRYPPQARF